MVVSNMPKGGISLPCTAVCCGLRYFPSALENGWEIQRAALLDYAHSFFDEQLSFNLQNWVRKLRITKVENPATLMAIEYGHSVEEEDIKRVGGSCRGVVESA
jgi:hypothetical protein